MTNYLYQYGWLFLAQGQYGLLNFTDHFFLSCQKCWVKTHFNRQFLLTQFETRMAYTQRYRNDCNREFFLCLWIKMCDEFILFVFRKKEQIWLFLPVLCNRKKKKTNSKKFRSLKKPVSSHNQPEQIECEIIERQSDRKPVSLLCEVFHFLIDLCDYCYKIESILHVIFGVIVIVCWFHWSDKQKKSAWQHVSCMNNADINDDDNS